MTRLLAPRGRTGGTVSQFYSINGLVHPFTDQSRDYVELMGKSARYSDFIAEVAEDETHVLVFVGTMPPETLAVLRDLDENTAKRLSDGLTDMSDAGRDRLRADLKRAGIKINPEARYTILDELSLLYKAVSSIDSDRLIYFENSIDEPSLKRRLGDRIDASTVSLAFTGEKPNVCVKDRGNEVCEALSIPRQRLTIS